MKTKGLNISDSFMVHMNQNVINEIVLLMLNQNAHGRWVAKKTGFPLTSVQRALRELEERNVIEARIEGKNRVYVLKRNIVAKNYVYSAESHKLVKVIEKYPFLGPLIEDIAGKCKNRMVLLFGSYAKFMAKPDSDIDIFIETNDQSIKKDVENLNSKLSVKTGNFDITSPLIREIIKNHAMISGIERFYEKIRFFEQD